MAAICEVKVNRRFWQIWGPAVKGHQEGHKRLQMMVSTHLFW